MLKFENYIEEIIGGKITWHQITKRSNTCFSNLKFLGNNEHVCYVFKHVDSGVYYVGERLFKSSNYTVSNSLFKKLFQCTEPEEWMMGILNKGYKKANLKMESEIISSDIIRLPNVMNLDLGGGYAHTKEMADTRSLKANKKQFIDQYIQNNNLSYIHKDNRKKKVINKPVKKEQVEGFYVGEYPNIPTPPVNKPVKKKIEPVVVKKEMSQNIIKMLDRCVACSHITNQKQRAVHHMNRCFDQRC